MNDSEGHPLASAPTPQSVRFDEVFHIERIEVKFEATAVKSLLEHLSQLLTKGHQYETEKNTIYQVLMERERLGSTCVGKGIALPHGRLHDLPFPVGAIIQLKESIKFGDHDDEVVSVVCGLLVPGSSTDAHLELVARLARGFETGDLHTRLIEADSPRNLLDELLKFDKP